MGNISELVFQVQPVTQFLTEGAFLGLGDWRSGKKDNRKKTFISFPNPTIGVGRRHNNLWQVEQVVYVCVCVRQTELSSTRLFTVMAISYFSRPHNCNETSRREWLLLMSQPI